MEEVKIPECHPYPHHWEEGLFNPKDSRDTIMEAFLAREKWMAEGMYAFVSEKWVTPLAEWIGNRKVLEVMAGRGWLAKALSDKGIDVRATDDLSWYKDKNGNDKWDTPLVPLENLDAVKAVQKYGSTVDIIIMSWPPYESIDAYNVLMTMRKVNSDCLMLYIGEGSGGCTAEDKFHETLTPVSDPEFQKVEDNFERWWGIHDHPYLVK